MKLKEKAKRKRREAACGERMQKLNRTERRAGGYGGGRKTGKQVNEAWDVGRRKGVEMRGGRKHAGRVWKFVGEEEQRGVIIGISKN